VKRKIDSAWSSFCG